MIGCVTESNMDKWHLATLILEMLGFGLAFIHVFHVRLTEISKQRIYSLRRIISTGFSLGAEDKSLSMETRDAMAYGGFIVRILQTIAWIVAFKYLNFGHGFWWHSLELVCSALIGLILGILAFLPLALVVNGIIWLAEQAGKGDIVVGVGFFLGAAGMAIETIEVLQSPLRSTAYTLWGFVVILSAVLIFRRRRLKTMAN